MCTLVLNDLRVSGFENEILVVKGDFILRWKPPIYTTLEYPLSEGGRAQENN